jgi:hypothetical protein
MPVGPTRLYPLLRVRGIVARSDSTTADQIRRATLQWLERRAGRLPPEAWSFGPFALDLGGTIAEVARSEVGGGELWSARLRYPDESHAGRVWRTELTLARRAGELRFGLKLDLAAREQEPAIDISVPRIARFVVSRIGLRAGASRLSLLPMRCDDGRALAEHLLHRERVVPSIVISRIGSAVEPWEGILSPKRLAERLAGIAEVHLVPPGQTFELSRTLGKAWSCYGGAVRLYRVPFRPEEDPFGQHPLFLPERIAGWEEDTGTTFPRHLALLAARATLGPAPADLEVPTFARVQQLARERRLLEARAAGQSSEQLLELAWKEIDQLKRQIEDFERERSAREADLNDLLLEAERERAEALSELHATRSRIALLEERLRQARVELDAEAPPLASYTELADWAERYLAGRLVLLPRAIREANDPLFADVGLVGRALLYLAGPYRELRLRGREMAGDLHDRALEALELSNQPVGGDLTQHRDRFRVDWRGQKRLLDQHLKNGGNTRDPKRCLRIYYFWDEGEQLVVVGSLPGHIRTGAT